MEYRIRWENKNFDDMGTLSLESFLVMLCYKYQSILNNSLDQCCCREDSKTKEKEPANKKVTSAETANKKVPSELRCPSCNNLLTDAVLIPCCGTSYCDDCKFICFTHVLLFP